MATKTHSGVHRKHNVAQPTETKTVPAFNSHCESQGSCVYGLY